VMVWVYRIYIYAKREWAHTSESTSGYYGASFVCEASDIVEADDLFLQAFGLDPCAPEKALKVKKSPVMIVRHAASWCNMGKCRCKLPVHIAVSH